MNTSWNVVNFRSGLVRALLGAGYQVTVAAPRDAFTPAVKALGCDYRELPMSPHGRSPLEGLGLIMRISRLLRIEKSDYLIAYTPKPNIYGSLAAALCGVPAINNIPGLGIVFNETGATSWLMRRLYRLALSRSRKVFFQNPDDLRLFVEAHLVQKEVVELLPGSGVDLNRFIPVAREGDEVTHFTFLLVARMLGEKGVVEFVEAGRIAREALPHIRLQLLGFIDDKLAASVPRAWIEQAHAEGLVEYLGESRDVRLQMAGADCVVLPSYYREGTPRTLLEALAMGKPLITTDMPGCREVVDPGSNGLLVPPRDIPALAQAMLAIAAASPETVAKMGKASREKAECEYDERIIIGHYLTVLRDCPPTGP